MPIIRIWEVEGDLNRLREQVKQAVANTPVLGIPAEEVLVIFPTSEAPSGEGVVIEICSIFGRKERTKKVLAKLCEALCEVVCRYVDFYMRAPTTVEAVIAYKTPAPDLVLYERPPAADTAEDGRRRLWKRKRFK